MAEKIEEEEKSEVLHLGRCDVTEYNSGMERNVSHHITVTGSFRKDNEIGSPKNKDVD